MNIQVLQGLNLKSSTTVINIPLSGEINTEILERISSFHPVFLDSYKIENNILVVESKLPHLWVEIGKALQKLSKRDWSYDYTVEFILTEVIKKQVLSMSTIPLLYSAMQEGLEITQYYIREGLAKSAQINRRYVIGAGAESHITTSSSSSKDSYIGFSTQREKILTNTILDRLGIQAPKWKEVSSFDEIKENWASFTKPIVIKPNGLVGGNGVVTNVNTLEQAQSAFNFALEMVNSKERRPYQKLILMQEQVTGEDYRLLVINGKFEIATKRIPANVTGDGINTIEQLIDITNSSPDRDTTNPAHTLKPIVKEQTLTDFLSEQGLTLSSIPKKGEVVYVRKVASMSKGGITQDFTDSVNPQIKRIVESLAQTLHAYTLGVDVFCKDISKPLTADNGAILECNTMPEAYLNTFPVIGKKYDNIGKIFLDGLISKDRTKRIVFVGKTLKEANAIIAAMLDNTNETIGVYSERKIYIDDQLINNNIDIQSAFEALKINASLTTIVHVLTESELKEFGSGFDRLDLTVINRDLAEIVATFEGYRNLNLISELKVQ